MAKTNPRRRPATAADVKRAWEDGVNDGVRNSATLFLTVLADYLRLEDRLPEIWAQVVKLSEEVAEGMITFADLRHVLEEEYSIYV